MTMNIKYDGNFTEAMKSFTEEKLYKIESKGIECDNVRVKLGVYPSNVVLEISVNNKIRNSKRGDDFYDLVVDVVDNICHQAHRYKKYDNRKRNVEIQQDNDVVETEDFSEVARQKTICPEEMTENDAIEMMEVLGHTFFVYRDVECKNQISIVYKRHDDKYGVIHCD